MANIKILHGDCLEVMKALPDNSIDTLITDPPYGLSALSADAVKKGKSKSGFMGKKWDYDVPSIEVWKECLRVLKPGATALIFAGSRTQHRMAINVEDAGFEIRDLIIWIYGCLSEDTEILTSEGWKLYHKNINNDIILCYDIDKDEFSFNKPLRSFIYENQYPAYSIQSDYTDQLVSRNHRVIVERGGRKIFKYAEELETKENIPFLESLYDLPKTIYDFQSFTSIEKYDLLRRVQEQENKSRKEGKKFNTIGKAKENNFNLSCMWNTISNIFVSHKKTQNSYLFAQVQRILQRSRVENTRTQGTSELETRERNTTKRTNDRRKKSSVERWYNIFQTKGEICKSKDKICKMSGRIHINGEKGRICNGTPIIDGKTHKETINENGVCTSHKSRCHGQQIGKSNVIQYKCGTQKVRRTDATIREVEYNGNVWCVEVPTGAFVARRNGKIFITGNSGFPKSLNVAKSIDRLQGNKREVVGEKPTLHKGENTQHYGFSTNGNIEITKDKTEWEGWGTALKPAYEPIIIAMKPTDGTYANNALKWGVSGLNIDGSRVGTEERTYGGMSPKQPDVGTFRDDNWKPKEIEVTVSGRFPANVILECICDELIEVDDKIAKNVSFKKNKQSDMGWGTKKCNTEDESVKAVIHTNPDCPCYMLDQQSGTAGAYAPVKKGKSGKSNGIYGDYAQKGDDGASYYGERKGGASRFFYTAKASKSERNAGCEENLGGYEYNKNTHPT